MVATRHPYILSKSVNNHYKGLYISASSKKLISSLLEYRSILVPNKFIEVNILLADKAGLSDFPLQA
jgi:hypothetical protein